MLLAFYFVEVDGIIKIRFKNRIQVHKNGIDPKPSVQELDTLGEIIQRKHLDSFHDGRLF